MLFLLITDTEVWKGGEKKKEVPFPLFLCFPDDFRLKGWECDV